MAEPAKELKFRVLTKLKRGRIDPKDPRWSFYGAV